MIPNSVEDYTEEEEEPEPDEETDEEEDSFLEPYYESEETSPGCMESGCNAMSSLLLALVFADVRYNSNPFDNGGTRSIIGTEGAPLAFSALAGATRTGGGQGWLVDAKLYFPCPLAIAVRYEEVKPEEKKDFSLIYLEVPMQFLYNLPVSLEIGPHLIFIQDEGEDRLTGSGVNLGIEYLFLDNLGISGDYRLSWISHLPLHDGEVHMSWYLSPLELWTGWGILRNSNREVLHGVRAGVGVFF